MTVGTDLGAHCHPDEGCITCGDVAPGDALLVHAGVAIARLGAEARA